MVSKIGVMEKHILGCIKGLLIVLRIQETCYLGR